MAFELLLAPRRDDQISHLRGQEAPQPAHAFDFAYLVGDALLQVLIEFLYLLCSVSQFFKKSRVLDCNDRLSGEGSHQFDLFLGERLYPRPPEVDYADRRPFAHKRNAEARPKARDLLSSGERVFSIGQNVVNVNRPTLFHHSPGEGPPAGRYWCRTRDINEVLRKTKGSHKLNIRTLRTNNAAHVGVAEPRGRFHERLEYRLQVKCRTADDPQDIGSGRLLLQRLP